MTKSELLEIILTVDSSTAKGAAGSILLTFYEPVRVIAAIGGAILMIMGIIEKYYAIKQRRKEDKLRDK